RHRARWQEDGPRRGDHLGLAGHRSGQDGSLAQGRREGRPQPDRGWRADGRGRQNSAPLTPVERLVRERIARDGPLPFSDVMQLALYHPEHGYYSNLRGFGADGDFI